MMKAFRKLPAEKVRELIFFPLLLIVSIFLAINLNFTGTRTKGSKELFSDKAGYYVYLPATFIYNWDINKFPKGLDKAVARGFFLQYQTQKIEIKYTYGVAFLISPFFLVTHFIASEWNLKPDGFSDIYEWMAVIPGVFYLVLGLFFLRRFLSYYFKGYIPWLTVILLFAGTNLYFYGIDEGLMSHVYSFFLFSLFLYLFKKFLLSQGKPLGIFIGLSLVFAFAVLVRPTNILLLTWMAFLDVGSGKEFISRLRLLIRPHFVLIMLAAGIFVFLPQFFYWWYLTGSFLYYSYQGETFIYLLNPRMIEVWFSPLNGFFIYSPMAILFIAGMVYMIVKKIPGGIYSIFFFLLITYIFSTWNPWYFGGSFGYRSFVEFYPLFALPFAYFLNYIFHHRNLFIRSVIAVFIFASGYFTLEMIYGYRWNTSSTWAWDDFLKRVEISGIYQWPGETYTFVDDFENPVHVKIAPVSNCVHSPQKGGHVSNTQPVSDLYKFPMWEIMKKPVRKVSISLWMNPGNDSLTGGEFISAIQDDKGKIIYYETLHADDFGPKPHQWTKITGQVPIPEWIDQTRDIMLFYFRNPLKKEVIYLDDVKLKFE